MKEDFSNDQAVQLRKRVKHARDEQHTSLENESVSGLPPRKETHRYKKKKSENRMHFSLAHILLVFFLIIVIAVLTGAFYYFEWL